MAILHGLSPAPIDRCRVLEVACNEGGNLIPMAYALPKSEFVGFDLAHLPIERGQQRIRELGLTNVRIFAGDLMEVGAELGQFDYILAHGLYAWVPEPVRDRLLRVCGELLAPNGVAFVSYDALPGGHFRRMTREMMLFGVKDIADAKERITEARGLLQLVLEARPEGDAYRQLLKKQVERMEKRNPQSIYHDELADEYHPLLFTEFVEHARQHGLQYLSEAALPPPDDVGHKPDFQRAIENAVGGDVLKQEQMMDFARMRVFRETLLCRAECVVRRDFPAEHLRRLLVASQSSSAPGQAVGAKFFSTPTGIKVETNHTGVIALMEMLEEAWPHALPLEELEPRLAEAGLVLDTEGAALLMQLAVARLIVFHAWKAPLAEGVSARPRASAISRQEAGLRPYATTLMHATSNLSDPVLRSLLLLLDGTRDRNALQEAMQAAHPELAGAELEKQIERALGVFYQAALLEA
jgi:SAM-dependent methyltransferase